MTTTAADTWVGQRLRRKEDARLVRGAGRFTPDIVVPGALNAGLDSVLFWASLAGSLVVAFVVTTPINRWMISRGKGHAVVHAYHH